MPQYYQIFCYATISKLCAPSDKRLEPFERECSPSSVISHTRTHTHTYTNTYTYTYSRGEGVLDCDATLGGERLDCKAVVRERGRAETGRKRERKSAREREIDRDRQRVCGGGRIGSGVNLSRGSAARRA